MRVKHVDLSTYIKQWLIWNESYQKHSNGNGYYKNLCEFTITAGLIDHQNETGGFISKLSNPFFPHQIIVLLSTDCFTITRTNTIKMTKEERAQQWNVPVNMKLKFDRLPCTLQIHNLLLLFCCWFVFVSELKKKKEKMVKMFQKNVDRKWNNLFCLK